MGAQIKTRHKVLIALLLTLMFMALASLTYVANNPGGALTPLITGSIEYLWSLFGFCLGMLMGDTFSIVQSTIRRNEQPDG